MTADQIADIKTALATLTPEQKSALLRKMVVQETAKMVREEVVNPFRQMLREFTEEVKNGR